MKTKHLFLAIGAAILAVVILSWFAFPGWRSTPGGFLILLTAAVIGVVALAANIVGIAKDWKDLKTTQKPTNRDRRVQKSVNSENVEQSMKGKGGVMQQTTENSKDIRQHME